MNLRDKILGSEDRTTVPVPIPEWDCTVYVTTMSGIERDAFEVAAQGSDGKTARENIRAKLAVFTTVDEKGKRVFGDGDAELLGDKNAAALDRIFNVATKINRLTEADMVELAKNSESGRGAASPSASPSPSA